MNEREWHYVKDGQQYGPVSEAALIDLFHQGVLGPSTRVWTQGMEDWHEASTVNALAPAVLPRSQREPLLAPQPFGSERPTSVTVFGILNIVFGSLGLLCMPLVLIASFVWPDGMNRPVWDTAWTVLSDAVGFVSSILLIVLGIGLLHLKAWARVWCLGYGWFAIVWGLVGMAITIPLLTSIAGEHRHIAVAVVVGGVCGGLTGLIYPALLIIFMQRPNVKEACAR